MLGARPLLAPLTRRCAPTPARLRRAPQPPSAKRERSRARPPCSTLLSHQWPPAPGTDPAHVGGERLHVRVGDEVLVGGHLDRLAFEEPAADRVLGDARELALGDPGAQLVVAAHQVVEVGAPETGHVALQRARVPDAPGAEGPVAGEAAEVARDLAAARRARLVGEELPRGGTQEGDQIVHLPSGHEAPVGRHAERRLLHLRAVVGILALAARRAVEDVLAEIAGRLHVHHLRALRERGHRPLLAARVLRPAAAPGPVARETPQLGRQPLPASRRRLLQCEQAGAQGRIGEPARLDHHQGDERPRERAAQPGRPVRFHRPPRLTARDAPRLSPLMRITRGVRERYVVLALLALLAGTSRARAESLAELLQAVAANARFASPARADVRIGRGDALYVEVKGGQRALIRPAQILVARRGKASEAAPGETLADTDVLLEDLAVFTPTALKQPQISDDGPAGLVVTAAPAGRSSYALLVNTIDRERRAIIRTLYYRDLINNLSKTRRDAAFARVGASWRPGEITVETVRQATKTHLTLSWREAPDVPDALFEPAGLGQPSGLGWP